MNTEVPAAQVGQYQAQGFIVIENFLDNAELERWRKDVAEAIAIRIGDKSILSNQGMPDSFYAQVFLQCLRLADIHPGMAELMFDEKLGRMAATLAGIDGIRIWHDQALIKPPYGNHTAFHLDNPFWSFHSQTFSRAIRSGKQSRPFQPRPKPAVPCFTTVSSAMAPALI